MTAGIEHIPIVGKLTIDLNKVFTMETLYESVKLQYPADPKLIITGITIPIIGIQCKNSGIINPINDIKESISRLYDYAMKSIANPIWTAIKAVCNFIKIFIERLGVKLDTLLNFKIPYLDLTIDDLLKNDLYEILKIKVLEFYNKNKAMLEKILKFFEIPVPLMTNISSPEIEVEQIVKQILASMWDAFLKKIKEVISTIKSALLLYDIVTKGKPFPTAPLWQTAIDTALDKILTYLTSPPTIQQIKDAIVTYAKILYRKSEVTYQEIIKALESFKLPIFGKPFDWLFPVNPSVNAPNIDFVKILSDIKMWITNFMMTLIKKFIELVEKILKLFGISFSLPTISIPMTMCAIKAS